MRGVVGWLRPGSRFAFERLVRQMHRTHRTQGIIFADGEDKGADTRGRHEEGVGPQQARPTLWRESGASGCTRRMK